MYPFFLFRKSNHFRKFLIGGAILILASIAFIVANKLYYSTKEVAFYNGDVLLKGTFFKPNKNSNPVAIIIHGSGRVTRDELNFYGRYLAKRGIGALTYDKRGAGESSGNTYLADYTDYALDAVQGLKQLKSLDENITKYGAVGFSEAEWVIPILAENHKLDFIAVIGASGLSPAGTVNSEIAIRLERAGFDDSLISKATDLNAIILNYQRTGMYQDSIQQLINKSKEESWFLAAKEIPEQLYEFEDYAWWRSVMDFKPEDLWMISDTPVLLIKGGNDQISKSEIMHSRMTKILPANRIEIKVYPKGDHAILEWPLGNRVPPPVFSDNYLNDLVEWIESL